MTASLPHASLAPSPWVTRWAHLIRPGGRVLDLACGHGRHAHWLAAQGFGVTALDREGAALEATRSGWPADAPAGTLLQADVENTPWPLSESAGWDAIVVTHYLWRPLWPTLLAALAPGGVYLHETFAHGNASVGKPSRPDFLLQPGELLHACGALRTVAFEDGFASQPDRYLQRIVAVREAVPAATEDRPPRYALKPPG